MPIYEYRCRACGRIFEAIVRSSAAAEPPPCPDCEASAAEKLPSVFAAGGSAAGGSASGGCGSGGFT